jgi:hypothetical protein
VVVGFVAVAPAFSREWWPAVGGTTPMGGSPSAPFPPVAAGLAAAPSPPAAALPLPTATPTPVVVVPSPIAEPPAGAFAPRGMTHAVVGAIGGAGQTDRYRFAAQRGQLLEARLERAPGGGLYGALALVAPSGAAERSAGLR